MREYISLTGVLLILPIHIFNMFMVNFYWRELVCFSRVIRAVSGAVVVLSHPLVASFLVLQIPRQDLLPSSKCSWLWLSLT